MISVDIDRYYIDVEYMQVFIAAEKRLDRDGLQAAKTWQRKT